MADRLVVRLNRYSFRHIDLPHSYNKSLSQLIDHIKSIIIANENYHDRKCEWFYIGKSTILEQERKDFDLDDQDTWDKMYIRKHWNRRKDNGHHAMAVLAIVTEQSRDSAQEYTNELKKDLITHFWHDKRLENDNKKTGRRAKSGAAYVLYLAMEFSC